jgi:hypothetical protein
MLIQVFPLLAISLIVYNVLVLVVGGPAMAAFLNRGIEISLFSGDMWKFTIADLLIIVSLVLLFVEILKSTITTANSIANHALSMLVAVIALVQFLMMTGFGTSTMFLVICMAIIDVIAGFSITIVASKRDLGVAPPMVG